MEDREIGWREMEDRDISMEIDGRQRHKYGERWERET